MVEYRSDLPFRPKNILKLPLDHRGYPCPWFISWREGAPEFRVVDPRKMITAHRFRLCWICGEHLGDDVAKAFVAGPMCAINRVSSEPPSHPTCADYAVRACPFMVMPQAKRRDIGKEEMEARPAPGHMITRNPGVSMIWMTKSYEMFRATAGASGHLFHFGDPIEVLWYREGRDATREEVMESIRTGFPQLAQVAMQQGGRVEAARIRRDRQWVEDNLLPRVAA